MSYSQVPTGPQSPSAHQHTFSMAHQMSMHPSHSGSSNGHHHPSSAPLNPNPSSGSSREREDSASSDSGSAWHNRRDSYGNQGGYPVNLPRGQRSSSYSSIGPAGFNGNPPPFVSHSSRDSTGSSLGDASRAIQTGHSGGDYSRYSAIPRPLSTVIPQQTGSSGHETPGYGSGTDSVENLYSLPYNQSQSGVGLVGAAAGFAGHHQGSRGSIASSLYSEGGRGFGGGHARYSTFTPQPLPKVDDSALLWNSKNAEGDDFLHNPEPGGEKPQEFEMGSRRGWINLAVLMVVVGGLLAVFLAWPVVVRYQKDPWSMHHVDALGRPYSQLIDGDTPQAARKWTSFETGEEWDLVFSDEFNKDGRTFGPGEDPFFEATSLNYYGTHNFEWTDPEAVTTQNGQMVITLSEKRTVTPHGSFDFQSGMIQSWNKLCFKDAYIEISASQPGNATSLGYWPGLWTMGNLARAGFGATNDGLWPYSYDACDVGTLRNQTFPDGTPSAARTSGSQDYGGTLSYLAGQRLSACTCPGEEHPGPRHDVGRNGPEIDLLEGMYYGRDNRGMASQSLQIAPFDDAYNWLNNTPHSVIHQPNDMLMNAFRGSINQEALSYIKYLDTTSYNGTGYTSFGYEYKGGSGDDSYITWVVNGSQTWTTRASAIGPNAATNISQRMIPVEPMYAIMNLFISDKFQAEIDEYALTYPAFFFIDYVRIYQKERNLDCSPKEFPTADYISNNIEAYTTWWLTDWIKDYGKAWPKSSLREGC